MSDSTTIIAVLATWIIIGVAATYIGYRCGRKAAIREMGLIEEWASFHRERRNGFAEVNEEVSGQDAPISMRGAQVTRAQYAGCYTEGTAQHPWGPPSIPRYRFIPAKAKKSH